MTAENNPVAKIYSKLHKAIVKSKLKDHEIAEMMGKSIGLVGIQRRAIKKGESMTTKLLIEWCEAFNVK